ncbi:MAG: hypothetical protein FWH12_00020 [Treponema sp.]|nr:hypothetical protein [Treponema sp.]
MFRKLHKKLYLLILILLVSCGFADLRPIGFSTVPAEPYALLPEPNSPVVLRFDTAMDKLSVENAVQVYSPTGTLEGRVIWDGNVYQFHSAAYWQPGIRYSLRIAGTIRAADGRDMLVSRDIPFYAIIPAPLPYVVSYFPPDTASRWIHDDPVLEVKFSHPMDRRSVEEALRLELGGEKIFQWLHDDTLLTISSKRPLNPWTSYRWSISERALSRVGAPLAKEVSGRFITDLDRDFISVVRVLPLMPPPPYQSELGYQNGSGIPPWGDWVPSALSLDQGLGSGHGIGVLFSKPVDADSLRRAFSFSPSLPGRVEILSPLSAVYIPTRDPDPEQIYNMRISGSLSDRDGLRMGTEFSTTLKADIPYLTISSITAGHGEELHAPRSGDILALQVSTGNVVRLFIHFALPFDLNQTAVLEQNVFNMSLRPFFPGTLPPVGLRSASWYGSDRLLIEWDGPLPGVPGGPHYYRFSIPGGPGGIHNGRGSYMEEDFVLFLEALP